MVVDLLVMAPPMRAFPDPVVGPSSQDLSDSTFVGVKDPRRMVDSRGAMMIGLFYLAVLATVPLAGGRPGALADLQLRRPSLAVAAILMQIVVISILPAGNHTLHTGVHIASYVLL